MQKMFSISAFKDFLPDEHEYFTYVKKVIRHRCRQAGFRRITPSFLLPLATCEKLLGSFSSDHLLRIEDCASSPSVVRFDPLLSAANAYHEDGMHAWPKPVELYCIEPFLEKDKEGVSYRDYFGLHLIGSDDSALTAQAIYLAYKILDDLGLKEFYTVQISHVGSLESRKVFLGDLKNFYFDKQRSLCESCVKAMKRGDFFELLRCPEEDCSILSQLAPKIENYLNKQDKIQFENLKAFLAELGVEYRENKGLFGMMHYNANTVFEFWHNDKGAGNVIIYGGSNDELIESLGGEKTNIIGFTSEFGRLLAALKTVGIRVPHKDHLQVFVAQLGTKAKRKSLLLLQKLREAGIQTVGAMGTGSMRTQLEMAMDFHVKYTILMGEVEVNEGMVIVRDMQTGTQESVPYDHVIEIMEERIGKEKIDKMEDEEKYRP